MRTVNFRTTIKRIVALGLGVSFLFLFKDIAWMICGGVLLTWAIVNILGDTYYTFEIISNIYDIIIGLSFIVFGVIITISDLDWTPLLFSALGLIIFLQGLLPIIDKIKSKHSIDAIKKATNNANEKQ